MTKPLPPPEVPGLIQNDDIFYRLTFEQNIDLLKRMDC